MNLKRLTITTAVAILAATGAALAWPVMTNAVTVPIGSQTAYNFTVPQGETRVLEADFTDGTNYPALTGMTADYLYRPPDGTVWYTAPATVSTNSGAVQLTWGPTLDNGSPRYTGWLRLLTGSNPTYRLQFDIRMIATPGFVPNATALTVSPIDFSVLGTNAPWLTNRFVRISEIDTNGWYHLVLP